jgi:ABC-2 type transport system permease protein
MTLLIAKRLAKFIIRDKRLLVLMLIVPILLALVIGYGFGGEISNVPVVILNNDDTQIVSPINPNETISFSETIINWMIENSSEISITVCDQHSSQTWNDSKEAVLDKEFQGAIYFPAAFTVKLAMSFQPNSTVSTSIETFVDNSNPNFGRAIPQALSKALDEVIGDFTGIAINTEYAFGEDLTQLNYMAPSILPYSVFFLAFLLSIISLLNERKNGTLNLLLLSPYHKFNIILGYMLTMSIISLIQSTILLSFVILFFNLTITGGIGSYLATYLMMLFVSWCGMGLGFFFSTLAKTELQAVQFIPIVIFPSMLLSGILWPIETMPGWLQVVSYFIPLTYGARYLRTVIIEGAGFLILSWDILAILIFVIGSIGISAFTLKQK